VKIFKIDSGNLPPELIYENNISTKGWSSHGFERNQIDGKYTEGYLERKITYSPVLNPGIYRVEVSTIKDIPNFFGTPSYLLMWKPLPFWSF
jgi:hypothetical protein